MSEPSVTRNTVLAYLDGLSDDAVAHIYPSDLEKCMTSECVVEVASVRAGNGDESTVPLFSREQVVASLAAAPQSSPTPQADSQPAQVLAYPPLPDLDGTLWPAIGQHRRAITNLETTLAAKAVDTAVYGLLCAYVDADRAARAPADSVKATAGGIPGNFITHRAAWRKALETSKAHATGDDVTYWDHELRAFDRSFDRLWALMQDHAPLAQAADSALADADRRAGAAERELAECKADVVRFEQVRDKMKYQWGVDRRVSFDDVWAEALSLKAATRADSVLEDAARLDWLEADESMCVFRVGKNWYNRLSYGMPYRKRASLRAAIDAARKQGANHD